MNIQIWASLTKPGASPLWMKATDFYCDELRCCNCVPTGWHWALQNSTMDGISLEINLHHMANKLILTTKITVNNPNDHLMFSVVPDTCPVIHIIPWVATTFFLPYSQYKHGDIRDLLYFLNKTKLHHVVYSGTIPSTSLILSELNLCSFLTKLYVLFVKLCY